MLALAGAGTAHAEVTGAADNLRTGWYPDEPALTPTLVNGPTFGKAFDDELKGQIYAQPLTANGTLLVATEDDWVYGLDPNSGAERWKLSVGTPENSSDFGCADLSPHIGITGTPVIDTASNIAYFVANRYTDEATKTAAWFMHAVRLDNGEEVEGFPVEIAGTAENVPGVTFDAKQQLQRPGLLMMHGVIYAGFGSHCDKTPYTGWLVGVSTAGAITTMWATTKEGGSIWQAGSGLVSDGEGQILFSTGNDAGSPGAWDPSPGPLGSLPPEEHLSESVVRVTVQPEGKLKATDFFSPSDNAHLDSLDLDLGSSAPIALPSQYFGTPIIPDLMVQSGKEGYVYLLNRQKLGGMVAEGESERVVAKLGPYGGVWDGAAAWPGDGGYVYVPAVSPAGTTTEAGDHLRFFKYGVNEDVPTLSLAATSPDIFGFGSGSPIVTSDGTTSGSAVLWITWCPETSCAGGELRAYSPVPLGPKELNVLWQTPIGTANKFSRPDASAGHIYVGNREGHVFAFSGPSLTPSTESLHLGAAPIGSHLAGQVTLTNTGTSLTVKGIRLPLAPFHVTGLPPEGTVIKPGESITVDVTFESATANSYTGSFGITTEAGEASVSLSASATAHASEPAATVTTASVPPPPSTPIISPPFATEPLASLADVKVRSLTGRHRRALLTYRLSQPAVVEIAVLRRTIARGCHSRALSCVRYVPTKLELTVSVRAGANGLKLDLNGLAPGLYRVLVTPLTRSGVSGIARTLYFRV